MSFLPGDYVQSIENDEAYPGVMICEGVMYHVQDIEPELWRKLDCSLHPGCRGDGVILSSPKMPQGEAWCSQSFRPIYRPKPGAFDYLLTPVDDLESV